MRYAYVSIAAGSIDLKLCCYACSVGFGSFAWFLCFVMVECGCFIGCFGQSVSLRVAATAGLFVCCSVV